MLKALMALSSSLKSIIVKTDNQFNRYISNFTHNQNFAFVSKETYLIFTVKGSVFTFDLKRELGSSSFSVVATKLFHNAGPRIDIPSLLLRSLVFRLLQLTLEKRVGYEWEGILK